MAASFNRVFIMGNLGQDPELRYTASQTPVCTLNVATTDYRTGADGQRQEQTEWHRVVVWSKAAENCAKYLTKGRPVMVEGRLQTRSWEDKTSGQKRYMTEIIAQNVQFLGTSAGAGARSGESMPQYADQDMGSSAGSSHPQSHSQTQAFDTGSLSGVGGPETPTFAKGLDDIPF